MYNIKKVFEKEKIMIKLVLNIKKSFDKIINKIFINYIKIRYFFTNNYIAVILPN